jgi:phenylacetate-CoA ligase
VLKERELAPHYRLEVSREGSLDRLQVVVERMAQTDAAAVAQRLAHLIKSYVGVSAQVIVGEPGSVERSVGKAKRVIDRRPS